MYVLLLWMNWGWDWIGRDAAVYAREKLKKRRAGGLPSQATIFAVRMRARRLLLEDVRMKERPVCDRLESAVIASVIIHTNNTRRIVRGAARPSTFTSHSPLPNLFSFCHW